MIDLHCHLLPGIDDGPETLAEALEMARIAVTNGIEEAYRAALAQAGSSLEIGFAAELRLDYEILPLIEAGRVRFLGTLDGCRAMLLLSKRAAP